MHCDRSRLLAYSHNVLVSSKIMKKFINLFIVISFSAPALAANQEIQSFRKAKNILEKQVYNNHRTTLYCGATFDAL